MKNKDIPTPVTFPLRRAWTEDGFPLLTLTIKLSLPQGTHPYTVDYYQTLAALLIDHCEHVLLPQLTHDYRADEDPRRRYTHRRHALTVSCIGECRGDFLQVFRTLTVLEGGYPMTVTHTDLFSVENGKCLPPHKAPKKAADTALHTEFTQSS